MSGETLEWMFMAAYERITRFYVLCYRSRILLVDHVTAGKTKQ